MTLEELLHTPQFTWPQQQKAATLLAVLNDLTEHHAARCPPYRRIIDVVYGGRRQAARLADVPYLPAGLFKTQLLRSIPEDEVFKTLTSSGTSGQRVSRIVLDRETARRQTAGLASIMMPVLGPDRLPMILVESATVVTQRPELAARGAGVVGMMNFGRRHLWALDADMQLDVAALQEFLHRFGRERFLIFGFTFMVWQYFYRRVVGLGLDLSNGILIHSGGWKRLQEEAVDNRTFKARLREATGLGRVYNFYGMVEQVGSVFLEGDDGWLYAPTFADVIVRDPVTWEETPVGTPGVIQVLSALPVSYPGHSILTEDLGTVHGVDDGSCGRRGKAFSILGRVPKAELRGCSDVHAFAPGAP